MDKNSYAEKFKGLTKEVPDGKMNAIKRRLGKKKSAAPVAKDIKK